MHRFKIKIANETMVYIAIVGVILLFILFLPDIHNFLSKLFR